MGRQPNHAFTSEERKRGAYARAKKLSERRARAQQLAEFELIGLVDKALQAMAQLLDSDNPSVRLRAAIHVLDRVLGKPVDRQEPSDSSGDLRYRLLSLVERVREQEAAKCEGESLG